MLTSEKESEVPLPSLWSPDLALDCALTPASHRQFYSVCRQTTPGYTFSWTFGTYAIYFTALWLLHCSNMAKLGALAWMPRECGGTFLFPPRKDVFSSIPWKTVNTVMIFCSLSTAQFKSEFVWANFSLWDWKVTGALPYFLKLGFGTFL